jgi:hypothetical protein
MRAVSGDYASVSLACALFFNGKRLANVQSLSGLLAIRLSDRLSLRGSKDGLSVLTAKENENEYGAGMKKFGSIVIAYRRGTSKSIKARKPFM